MTKFKTDENIPVEAAHNLQRSRHDTMTIAEQHMAGQIRVRTASQGTP